MLARCYVLVGADGIYDASPQQTAARLQMPILGSTLGEIGRSLTSNQLGCCVQVVTANGAGALSGPVLDPAARCSQAVRDALPPCDEQSLVVTDGCAIAGVQAEALSRLLKEHGGRGAAFVRVDGIAGGYREDACLDEEGRLQAIARRYPTDVAPPAAEAEQPHLLIVRCAVLRSICQGRLPVDFGTLCRLLQEAGVKATHTSLAGRTYRLMVDDDVLQLQVDMLSSYRHLLPRPIRRAASEPVTIDQTVFIADSAVMRGPVVLGRNVRIEEEATVLGPCTIGDGAVIGRGCLLRNAVIMPGARVPDRTRCEFCILGLSNSGMVTARPQPARSPRSVAEPANPAAETPGSRYYRLAKRAMDVTIAVGILLLFLPFLPLVALAIRLDSCGPVFFVDRRQTRRGRSFGCIKFRTMVPGAKQLEQQLRTQNKVDGLHVDIADDPRITRVGSFLRRANLDELPQLINVLRGDMSVVGPRPSPDNENRLCPAWRDARLSVRAGITGLWQVCRSPDRDENDFQEWIYYDIEYLRHGSIWLDIRILLRTVGLAIGGFLPILWRLRRHRQVPPAPWWRPAAARYPHHR